MLLCLHFILLIIIDACVHNVHLKFADDTKICSRICNSDEVQKLQEDLNTLQ